MSAVSRYTHGQGLEKARLTLGFIPLTDCAPLVVAQEKGWFARHGLEVTLSRETSWANVRDKLAIGVLDGAQILAPVLIASTLGLGPIHKPMVTALSLDLNGNAITVSDALYRRLRKAHPQAPDSAAALKRVIDQGGRHLTFATVFPFSSHNYQLRYWMAAAGIDPERDVRLVVIPPPQMPAALEQGVIDGYCVGEPWNEVAVHAGVGHVLTTSYEIWNNNPEKVLGVTEEWAAQNPNTHRALLMALLEAARWMDLPENRAEVVELIARSHYVNAPEHVVRMSMTGTFQYGATRVPRSLPDFNVFHRYAANFPWRSHGLWFLTQMVRWGQIGEPLDLRATVEAVYCTSLYREAAGALGIACPTVDYKDEGSHGHGWTLTAASAPIPMGPDRFLDGGRFDPQRPLDYLDTFDIEHSRVDRAALERLNPAPHCACA